MLHQAMSIPKQSIYDIHTPLQRTTWTPKPRQVGLREDVTLVCWAVRLCLKSVSFGTSPQNQMLIRGLGGLGLFLK